MTNWDIPSMKTSLNDTSTERVFVVCGCGRSTPMDSMLDLSVLPEAKSLPNFVCGACWFVLQAEGVTTYREVAEAHSAPREALTRIDAETALRFGSAPLPRRHSQSIQKNRRTPNPIIEVRKRPTSR